MQKITDVVLPVVTPAEVQKSTRSTERRRRYEYHMVDIKALLCTRPRYENMMYRYKPVTDALHIGTKRSQRIAILKGQSLEKCLTRLQVWIFKVAGGQFEFFSPGSTESLP